MLAVRINRWLAQLRAVRPTALLARSVILLAGVFALGFSVSRPWDALDATVLIAALGLLLAVGAPDSPAPLLFMAATAAGWLARGPVGATWSVLILAVTLLVMHLACAFAAQFPAYAVVSGRVLAGWLPAATVAGLVTALVAGAGAVIRGTEVEGSLTVTVAALAGITLIVWLIARD
jgi:hypothetical protein